MNRLTETDELGNWGLKGIRLRFLYPGKVITQKMWEVLYGALAKLKDYENTGLTPDEIVDGKMLSGWITVGEQLPKPGRIVLVTVKHSEWISDLHSDWVDECEKIHHQETCGTYLGCIDKNGNWMFVDEEKAVVMCEKSVGDDLERVYDVVTAWQPLPEPYAEPYTESREKAVPAEWKRHMQERFERAE